MIDLARRTVIVVDGEVDALTAAGLIHHTCHDALRFLDRALESGTALILDACTAAAALRHGRPVATDDRDLRRFDDLRIVRAADRSTLPRIDRLIDDALRDPVPGIGRPEPPPDVLAGAWSRRSTDEHRSAHLVEGDDLVVLQADFHHS